jgi:uncharacterized protein (DUF4415 family)
MSGESTTRAILTQDGEVMIEQPDGSYRKADSKTDWERVNAWTDAEIEAAAEADPDAPPLDDVFWANARMVMPPRIPKNHEGTRFDAEVIDWFKAQGPGWQTRMNAVLRAYVEARKRRGPSQS